MTVRDIWVAGHRVKVTGVGYEPVGSFQPNPLGKAWEKDLLSLLEVASGWYMSCCSAANERCGKAQNKGKADNTTHV
jgi:hypothetical protein